MAKLIRGVGVELEEAVEEVEVNPVGEEKSPEKQALVQDCYNILQDYFSDRAHIILEDLDGTQLVGDNSQEVFSNVAPFAFSFVPQTIGDDPYLSLNACEKYPESFLKCYLGIEPGEVDLQGGWSELLPEVAQLKSITMNGRFNTTFPYMVVMGLAPEQRPLPTIALARSEVGRVDEISVNKQKTRSTLLTYTPTLRDMVPIAREYGAMSQLKNTMENIAIVTKMYAHTWKL